MNILAAIKSGKRLSFNHWRYRILHWCFNEKAKTPEESELPYFLYSHYCPLFHLTNLIAIMLPFIIVVKLVVAFFKGFFACIELIVDLPWDKARCRVSKIKKKIWPEKEKKEKYPTEKTEEEIEKERQVWCRAELIKEKKTLLSMMLGGDYDEIDFEYFWERQKFHCLYLQKEEAELFYITRMKKIIATKKRVAEKKEKLQERLIFWTQFSQVFIKWIFNIFYVCLALFVLWVVIKVTPPVFLATLSLIHSMSTFEVLPFLIFCGTWLVRIVVVVGAIAILVYGFWRYEILRKCGATMASSFMTCAMPFKLFAEWAGLPFIWAAKSWNAFWEFWSMFYEQNCPPITIISAEDEMIDKELDEAE